MNEINRKFRKSRGFGFVETLNGYVFTPEANAHTFRIQCVVQEDNLETVVPFETGSVVSARFLKSDHVTELVEGSLDENGAAVVTLPAECYAVPGRFLLTILVAYNSISVCVYAATGTVIGAESGTVNLSQNASREIDEKIAELNAAAAQVSSAISAGSAKITEINQAAAAARASIPQDYTALSDSVGDLKSAFNTSTLYPFECDKTTILTRPNYPSQTVYSSALNGILYLHMDLYHDASLYVHNLYRTGHMFQLTAYPAYGVQAAYTYTYDIIRPDGEDTTTHGISVYKLKCDRDDRETGTVIIDWSKINPSSGQRLADDSALREAFKIQDNCIERHKDERILSKYTPVMRVESGFSCTGWNTTSHRANRTANAGYKIVVFDMRHTRVIRGLPDTISAQMLVWDFDYNVVGNSAPPVDGSSVWFGCVSRSNGEIVIDLTKAASAQNWGYISITFTIDSDISNAVAEMVDATWLNTDNLAKTSEVTPLIADKIIRDRTVGYDYNRYPFVADATLQKGSVDWYLSRGIAYLRLPVTNTEKYHFESLYSRHSSTHYSNITIRDDTNSIRYHVAQQLFENVSSIPDEWLTYPLLDNDNNEIPNSCIILNWKLINTAIAYGMDYSQAGILEECLVRAFDRAAPTSIDAFTCKWSCPDDYYVIVGSQYRIYYDEIITTNLPVVFDVNVSGATYPEVTYSDDYVQFNFAGAKNVTINIHACSGYMERISSKSIVVHAITADDLPAKKYLFLGDSLTEAGWIESTFQDLATNAKCTLYGTRLTTRDGVARNHEGRSGWSAGNYVNDASKGSVTNEFYNPSTSTFDFSYYMQNHSEFADVDVVNIFLGRNDGFNFNNLQTRLQTIIASIHAFNPNIIITLMSAYNVAADMSGSGKYLQNNVYLNVGAKNYNNSFWAWMGNKESENIYIIPQNLFLDPKYDYERTQVAVSARNTEMKTVYVDNVHPAKSGYQHMADVYFAYMCHILGQ